MCPILPLYIKFEFNYLIMLKLNNSNNKNKIKKSANVFIHFNESKFLNFNIYLIKKNIMIYEYNFCWPNKTVLNSLDDGTIKKKITSWSKNLNLRFGNYCFLDPGPILGWTID